MVGSCDHRPLLSQVAGIICPLQVKLRVDPTSAGSGGDPLMVTLFAGVGLEGQVTAVQYRQKLGLRLVPNNSTNSRNHWHHITARSNTVDSSDGHIVGSVVGDSYLCRGGLHGDW